LSEVPGCSEGFRRINSLAKKENLTRLSHIGNAQTILVKATALLETVIDECRQNPDFLLCENNSCPACSFRKKENRRQNPGTIMKKYLWETAT